MTARSRLHAVLAVAATLSVASGAFGQIPPDRTKPALDAAVYAALIARVDTRTCIGSPRAHHHSRGITRGCE